MKEAAPPEKGALEAVMRVVVVMEVVVKEAAGSVVVALEVVVMAGVATAEAT